MQPKRWKMGRSKLEAGQWWTRRTEPAAAYHERHPPTKIRLCMCIYNYICMLIYYIKLYICILYTYSTYTDGCDFNTGIHNFYRRFLDILQMSLQASRSGTRGIGRGILRQATSTPTYKASIFLPSLPLAQPRELQLSATTSRYGTKCLPSNWQFEVGKW
jgi:hypothetical protein